MSGMPYGFIKRRTFQKDPFESEAQQLHVKNRYMSNTTKRPKGFYITSYHSGFPTVLHQGGKPLFENFDFLEHRWCFSHDMVSGFLFLSMEETDIFIGLLLEAHPRFAPLSVLPIYL